MKLVKGYPTKKHKLAADKFVEIFSKDPRVMTILLTCSCARGKACKDSCLDLNVLVKNEKDSDEMEKKFKKLDKSVKEFKEVKKVGAYTQIDFNVNSGNIVPKRR